MGFRQEANLVCIVALVSGAPASYRCVDLVCLALKRTEMGHGKNFTSVTSASVAHLREREADPGLELCMVLKRRLRGG